MPHQIFLGTVAHLPVVKDNIHPLDILSTTGAVLFLLFVLVRIVNVSFPFQTDGNDSIYCSEWNMCTVFND